jgi:hypothetical protein
VFEDAVCFKKKNSSMKNVQKVLFGSICVRFTATAAQSFVVASVAAVLPMSR